MKDEVLLAITKMELLLNPLSQNEAEAVLAYLNKVYQGKRRYLDVLCKLET